MNRHDIIAMARECGIEFQSHDGITGRTNVSTRGSQSIERIERLIALAIAKDRERLAAGVELPERVGDGYTRMAQGGDTPSTMFHTRISVVGVDTFTADQLRDYGDRRAAAEREACAALIEPMGDYCGGHGEPRAPSARDCAKAIRARGQQ